MKFYLSSEKVQGRSVKQFPRKTFDSFFVSDNFLVKKIGNTWDNILKNETIVK